MVSVVIPTYNGAHRIYNVLDSLVCQTHLPDEVLLVIDGSTDNTKELVLLKNYSSINLKIIERLNGGRAKVRNTGAQEAKYDLLFFIDDDMIAPPNWIQEHISIHEKNKNIIVTGNLKEPRREVVTDFLQFKSWLNNKWTKDFDYSHSNTLELKRPYLTANNMSLPRSVFDHLHGFDENLTDAEDYDFAVRAFLLNYKILFSQKAFSYHNDNDNVTCRVYIKRLRDYSAAHSLLKKMKPNLYQGSRQYVSVVPVGLKGILFRCFTFSFWIYSIDAGYWRWIPKSIRFKLYDIVVTANGSFFVDRVSL